MDIDASRPRNWIRLFCRVVRLWNAGERIWVEVDDRGVYHIL